MTLGARRITSPGGGGAERLLLPNAPSANALSKELQIPQSTLSRWVRLSGRVAIVGRQRGIGEQASPSEDWSAEERLRAVTEAGRLEGEELGKFLRREGLHEETLREWRQAAIDALQPARPRGSRAERRRIEMLERKLAKKEKGAGCGQRGRRPPKKRVHALLGDADDDTEPESDK
jgi:hypothetical protein